MQYNLRASRYRQDDSCITQGEIRDQFVVDSVYVINERGENTKDIKCKDPDAFCSQFTESVEILFIYF